MKTIEAVSIWDNGTVQQATILNSYAVNVTLNTSATFWYGLFSTTEGGNVGVQLAQGNLVMTGEAYTQWQSDNYAWDWIAGQLNLTITGEYVPPVPPEPTPIVEETVVVEEPIV
jgi:hypothetical protein